MKAQIIFIGGEQTIYREVKAVKKVPTLPAGRYELWIELAHGGIGAIYECEDIIGVNMFCIDE